MAKLIATLRDNTTGETKTIEQDCPFDGDPDQGHYAAFHWTDGSFGCDCNRALLFYGDENYPSHLRQRDDREGVQCGENAFTLERLVVGGEVVVRDNEELDNYENT